jgi:small ligand-binding sensory domain FIST
MHWLSASSESPQLRTAFAACAASIEAGLHGLRPDLVLAFVSPVHRSHWLRLGELVAQAFPGASFVGCSAESVIGGGREIEGRPGLALTAGVLPGVSIRPFHVHPALPDAAAPASTWTRLLGIRPEDDPSLLVFGEPFSLDAEALVSGLDVAFPQAPKLGGLASGGRAPGECTLFLDDRVIPSGAVGVALSGDLVLDTIVAQGCRPIGNPMFVTRSRDGVLFEVDGQPPLDVLQRLFDRSSAEDRELMRSALLLGIEMTGGRSEYRQGDFLIRGLLGMDDANGSVAAAALLQDMQVVQFHVRDAATSAADLEEQLARYRAERGAPKTGGVLLFSCLGRGAQLYGTSDHDSDAVRRHLGDLAVGGFFCNGEIGPVQGRTFVHGHTSALAILRPRD